MSEDSAQHAPRNGDRVLAQIERRLERIEVVLGTLTALEYDHRNTKDSVTRAFIDIEKHHARLTVLEQQAPVAELVRKWVLGIIWIAVAGVAGTLISLVMPSMRGGAGITMGRGH